MSPKAGELWRFLVIATPGSHAQADKEWVQVLIPPGQARYHFAARPELRIPGAAPMTYVDDPTPATVSYEDENDPEYYFEQYSPPRLVLDAWGRTPAQAAAATAAAEARSKADPDAMWPWTPDKLAKYPDVTQSAQARAAASRAAYKAEFNHFSSPPHGVAA